MNVIRIQIQEIIVFSNQNNEEKCETEHNGHTCTDRSVDVALANRLAEVAEVALAFARLDFSADAGGI